MAMKDGLVGNTLPASRLMFRAYNVGGRRLAQGPGSSLSNLPV